MKNLHNIGKKIDKLASDAQRGREPYKLKGSGKLPTYVVDKPAYKPKITVCEPFKDTRFSGENAEEYFSATFPGVDPETKKPWSKR